MAASALKPEQVWVIDSTPSRRTPDGDAVRMLQTLRSLPARFDDRSDAVDRLQRQGLAAPVAHWMATNLELVDGAFRWRFDLDDMEALLSDFFRRDLWDVVESPAPPATIHFVRASESDVVEEEELERVRAAGSGRVHGHELHGGHWLHQDNPAGLLELVSSNLP